MGTAWDSFNLAKKAAASAANSAANQAGSFLRDKLGKAKRESIAGAAGTTGFLAGGHMSI